MWEIPIGALFVSSDSIEDYIQTASSNVESANQELAKANRYQVKELGEGGWASPHSCIDFAHF